MNTTILLKYLQGLKSYTAWLKK